MGKKVSAKEVLTDRGFNWIITRISKGLKGRICIDARRRHPVADESAFFCKWVSLKYANRIRVENDLNKIEL